MFIVLLILFDFRDSILEWRPEDRFKLRRKLKKVVIDTPEKPWDLPEYVLRSVNAAESEPVLTWEMKGRRLLRGSDRKFIRNRFIDDEAGQASQFVDFEAVSTSRSESGEGSESCATESTSESRSSEENKD